MGDDGFVWESPDGGTWTLDRTHFDRPITFYAQTDRARLFEGQHRGFAAFGIGLGRYEVAMVNGWHYGRRLPVGPGELAAREPVAEQTLATKRWRGVRESWLGVRRGEAYQACRDFQEVDPARLDDAALAAHLEEAHALMLRGADTHFEHISLFTAVGALVLACEGWGFSAGDAVQLLQGASPASAGVAEHLLAIAEALARAGVEPRSLDDVRRAGGEAAAALDAYLDLYGWRIVSGFDLDAVALREVPEAVLASIATAGDPPSGDGAAALAARLRAKVPAEERARFDELLADARGAYGVRDDDVGAVMWARGLLRRALLEAARRLAGSGRLHARDDVFEATPDEVRSLLRGGSSPAAGELAARADLRRRQATAKPPAALGPPPTPPDLDAMPPAVRRLTASFLAYGRLMFLARGEPMRGFGIGGVPHRGRACVTRTPDEALARLAPGDVLVTTMTTPAYNSVLSIAGALVTEEGGLLSHAGIIARELGIPAVIGAAGVMESIDDGDLVEVDPLAGTVRVVDPE